MKVSTIMLATLFMGAVCLVGMRSPQTRRTVLYDTWDQRAAESQHMTAPDSVHPSDSALLQRLRNREVKLKKQVREIESVLKKIEKSKQYLEDSMAEWSRESHIHKIEDPQLEQEFLTAASDNQATLFVQLQSIKSDEAQFRGFLEQCRGEQATLKVKIDLYDLSAKKASMKEFFNGDAERSPVDDLGKARQSNSTASW